MFSKMSDSAVAALIMNSDLDAVEADLVKNGQLDLGALHEILRVAYHLGCRDSLKLAALAVAPGTGAQQ